MDGNQVPQGLVTKVGEAFESILKEACLPVFFLIFFFIFLIYNIAIFFLFNGFISFVFDWNLLDF